MVDGVGVCTVCAKVCHKDHDLTYAKFGSFFCDCGAKDDGSCKVSKLPVFSLIQCDLYTARFYLESLRNEFTTWVMFLRLLV